VTRRKERSVRKNKKHNPKRKITHKKWHKSGEAGLNKRRIVQKREENRDRGKKRETPFFSREIENGKKEKESHTRTDRHRAQQPQEEDGPRTPRYQKEDVTRRNFGTKKIWGKKKKRIKQEKVQRNIEPGLHDVLCKGGVE